MLRGEQQEVLEHQLISNGRETSLCWPVSSMERTMIDMSKRKRMVLDQITVTRYITEDGAEMYDFQHSGDAGVVTILGLLDLARDTFIKPESFTPGE